MSDAKLGVAIVGCGQIAKKYAADIAGYAEVDFRGVTDLDNVRAEQLASAHGVALYPTLDAVLADPEVNVVVNLTTHHAHRAIVGQCLKAGKHVHSEKPLSLEYGEARELVELAERESVRLSCSPSTFMGEAQQTAIKFIGEGRLGTVRLVFAEMNWGRLEMWHPNPKPFYDVGAWFDVGLYPLTLAAIILGPARRVAAYSHFLKPGRTTKDGEKFRVDTPELMTALVEFEGGCVARVTANFYVGMHTKQKGMEFHGDDGSLWLQSPSGFGSPVEFASFGGTYEPVQYVREPTIKAAEFGRGVQDLVRAILDDRPHRAAGDLAAHVVEILCASRDSAKSGKPVDITSDFETPALMEWT